MADVAAVQFFTPEQCREMQENELESVQSIYYDVETIDLRRPENRTKKKWKPLHVKFQHIKPKGVTKEDEIFCTVSLVVTCRARYPEVPPSISLEDVRGLTETKSKELLELLNDKATEQSAKPDVCLFQLIERIELFLEEHNKPLPNLFEERHQEILRRDMEQLQIQQEDQVQERLRWNEEIMKKKMQNKIDGRTRRVSSQAADIDLSPSHHSTALGFADKSEMNNEAECRHRSTEIITFGHKRFIRGQCLGHHSKGCSAFIAIDNDSGQSYYLTEWNIPYNVLEKQNRTPEDVVKVVEDRFPMLQSINHRNLVSYVNFLINRKKDHLQIYLLQDYIRATSIKVLKFSDGWISEGVRFLAKSVLAAIKNLNDNSLTHKYLIDSSVYIDLSGHVRVADFDLIPEFVKMLNPDTVFRNDFYALGVIIENIVDIPNENLSDFISACKSNKLTLTASELLGHSFLHSLAEPRVRRESVAPAVAAVEIIERPRSRVVQDVFTTENSRLARDFDIICEIGSGAFGQVLKGRNRLDGQVYALKKIVAKNKSYIRKLSREVNLLASLNHEHVVRYYTSWIETGKDISEPTSSNFGSESESRIPTPSKEVEEEKYHFNDWMNNVNLSEELDDDDDDNDDDEDTDDDLIQFQHSNGEPPTDDEEEEEEETSSKTNASNENRPVSRVDNLKFLLCIQMEFCDKNTLRHAIDDNLYKSEERMWRLFREICEGLNHMHQQSIIHRDLKPVNIFLDSYDRVKIGDLGLATTSILAIQDTMRQDPNTFASDSHTGIVGTAMYVAPELSGLASQSTYNAKVDIYSLGVIFFEMCNPPASTGMERVQILTNLRTPQIILPESFENNPENAKKVKLIRLLLKHKNTERPSAADILVSDLIEQPKMEKKDADEVIRSILKNRSAQAYYDLVRQILEDELDQQTLQTYYRLGMNYFQYFEFVKDKFISLFRKHGAKEVITPALVPYEIQTSVPRAVRLMSRGGYILTLPQDLNRPFVNWLAQQKTVTNYRRYSIGRVYREKLQYMDYPVQLFEATFDIVTSNEDGVCIDAELLTIAFDIVNELPELRKANVNFKMSHTNFLKAMMEHFNLEDDDVSSFRDFMVESKGRKNDLIAVINTNVTTLNRVQAGVLADLLLIDTRSNELYKSPLKVLLNSNKPDVGQLVETAMKDIDAMVRTIRAFGVTCEVTIVTHFHESDRFNTDEKAIIWQMNGESKSKSKSKNKNQESESTTIAIGGRYDKKLENCQRKAYAHSGNSPPKLRAAGFSFALNRIVQILRRLDEKEPTHVDGVMYIQTNAQKIEAIGKVLRSMWTAKIRIAITEAPTIDEAFNACNELNAKFIFEMFDDGDLCFNWRLHNQNYSQETVTRQEVVTYVLKKLNMKDSSYSSNEISNGSMQTPSRVAAQNEFQLSKVDIKIVEQSYQKKKGYDMMIKSHISDSLQKFSAKQNVTILVVELPKEVIGGILASIDLSNMTGRSKEYWDLLERYPKHKERISNVFDEAQTLTTDQTTGEPLQNPPIIGIYSLNERYYRFLI